jgi:hypothetical protein
MGSNIPSRTSYVFTQIFMIAVKTTTLGEVVLISYPYLPLSFHLGFTGITMVFVLEYSEFILFLQLLSCSRFSS